jgi:hypothetical protein
MVMDLRVRHLWNITADVKMRALYSTIGLRVVSADPYMIEIVVL